jgi:hypothetical protein
VAFVVAVENLRPSTLLSLLAHPHQHASNLLAWIATILAIDQKLSKMPSRSVASPMVGGVKLALIMTGLCLAVLLTGWYARKAYPVVLIDSSIGSNYSRDRCTYN